MMHHHTIGYFHIAWPAGVHYNHRVSPLKWAMIFEHKIYSGNLQGAQVKECGRYLHASVQSCFLKNEQIFAKNHSFDDYWKRWAQTDLTWLLTPWGLWDAANQVLKLLRGLILWEVQLLIPWKRNYCQRKGHSCLEDGPGYGRFYWTQSELTVKFFCLLKIILCNTTSAHLGVFFLTIVIPIEASGSSL